MHELAVAQSIFDAVLQEKVARRLATVSRVGVRVGVLSDVLPDALTFSFDAICADSQLKGCELVVERVPLSLSCEECATASIVEEVSFLCPQCGSSSVQVEAGFDLDIAYIEVPESSPTQTT